MKVSLEPTSNGVKIEVPEACDNENPYFETPDISELMPVIFPGGGGGACGGGASGDWYASPVSGDGMLSEIATFCGWAGDWSIVDAYPYKQIGRSRFLGNTTMERRGGEASATEILSARRGYDEPLKRYVLDGYEGHSGYNQLTYVFDGGYLPRSHALPIEYPAFDPYASVSRECAIGEYTLDCWQYCLSHNFWRCGEGAWIEQRAENGDFALSDIVPVKATPFVSETITHQNIVQHFRFATTDWVLDVWKDAKVYTSYDVFENGVYKRHVPVDHIYTRLPSDAYAENGEYKYYWERQHYPKIGNEVFQLRYRPSPLPVILGGALPSYLILIAIIMLCAVSNNSVTSFVSSDNGDDKQVRRRG